MRWRTGSRGLRDVLGEVAHAPEQCLAAHRDRRRRVEVRRCRADEHRAAEVLTDVRPDGVAVPAGFTGAGGGEQADLRRRLRGVAERAHRGDARAERAPGGPDDDAHRVVVDPGHDVAAAGGLRVAPAEELALVPQHLVQAGDGELLELVRGGVHERRTDVCFGQWLHGACNPMPHRRRARGGRQPSREARIAPSALVPSATSTARRRASRPTRRAAASSAANSTSTRVERAMARAPGTHGTARSIDSATATATAWRWVRCARSWATTASSSSVRSRSASPVLTSTPPARPGTAQASAWSASTSATGVPSISRCGAAPDRIACRTASCSAPGRTRTATTNAATPSSATPRFRPCVGDSTSRKGSSGRSATTTRATPTTKPTTPSTTATDHETSAVRGRSIVQADRVRTRGATTTTTRARAMRATPATTTARFRSGAGSGVEGAAQDVEVVRGERPGELQQCCLAVRRGGERARHEGGGLLLPAVHGAEGQRGVVVLAPLDLALAAEAVEHGEHGGQRRARLREGVEDLPRGAPGVVAAVRRGAQGLEDGLLELPAGARSLSCHPRILRDVERPAATHARNAGSVCSSQHNSTPADHPPRESRAHAHGTEGATSPSISQVPHRSGQATLKSRHASPPGRPRCLAHGESRRTSRAAVKLSGP
ncbi:hypothetical protein Cus16_1134 [Curtobacterium sp. ER1/6]|nr:hypothetical protein Cus16_1134 [Curtobacterium sp. ER1/6]